MSAINNRHTSNLTRRLGMARIRRVSTSLLLSTNCIVDSPDFTAIFLVNIFVGPKSLTFLLT